MDAQRARVIDTVKPKTLFPIHTEEPDYFKKVVEKSRIVFPIKEKSVTVTS